MVQNQYKLGLISNLQKEDLMAFLPKVQDIITDSEMN